MRILLAQDEAHNGSKVQMLLELAGHSVHRVTSGAQAIAAFQADPFPVIVADLENARPNGYELCRHIRARLPSEYVYIILLVASGTEFRFQEAEAAQVDDVLAIPVEADILRARIRVAERILHLYEELDRLRGLIPICAYCKKIRNRQGIWQQMEVYISEHSHAMFSHTICSECAKHEFSNVIEARSKNQRPDDLDIADDPIP